MNFKVLKKVSRKYSLIKYINTSLNISAFDSSFSYFYIIKRNVFSRIFSKDSKLKYMAFKNEDYSMRGSISNVSYFKDKNAAAEYVWCLFKEYVKNMSNEINSEKVVNQQNFLLDIIDSVENEYK